MISAPGYLPRIVDLTYPGTPSIDGSLTPPSLTPTTPDVSRDVHLDDVAVVRWSPSAFNVDLAVVASPAKTLALLEAELAADDVARQALRIIADDVARGQLSSAASLANVIAAPLPPRQAALILQLPGALVARSYLRAALTYAAQGDTRSAMSLALAARALDPLIAPEAFAKVRHLRVVALRAKGRAAGPSAPLLARAYFVASTATAQDDAERRAALADDAAIDVAALDRVAVRLALVSRGGTDIAPKLAPLLSAQLPRHVSLFDSTEKANATLSFAVSDPVRSHDVSRGVRTVSVPLGDVKRANPDYEDAMDAVRSAHRSLVDAITAYQAIHEAALKAAEAASEAGLVGKIVGGVVAVGGEAGALALVHSARSDLDDAVAKFQRTPRTVMEKVVGQTSYPFVTLVTKAETQLRFQLAGFGDDRTDATSVTVDTSSEFVPDDPDIGVAGQAIALTSAQSLSPSIDVMLASQAQKIGQFVRAEENARALGAFREARATNDVLRAVTLAGAYLTIAATDAPERTEVIAYLVENMP